MSNLWDQSLTNIGGLSIYFSSDCNMACKYCYIEKDKQCMASYNRNIREALKNGTFAENIKKRCENIKNQIDSLSLWGAEPTINSVYFNIFIKEMLNFFPRINNFMFSTNALLGGELLYNDFVIPLMNYCNENQREIEFELQLSLDGPTEFNDDSRHEGATASTLNALRLLAEKVPESEYFTLVLLTKPTLDVSYMRIMNEAGIPKFQWYFDFMVGIKEEIDQKIQGKKNIKNGINIQPTLVDPGWHTVEDGKTLAQWVHNLRFVDQSKWHPSSRGLLFVQPYNALKRALEDENIIAHGADAYSCSASKNNITIDYEGNIYTCNRLCKNTAMPEEYHKKHVMQSNSTLNNVIDKQWVRRTWGSFSYHDNILSRWYIAQGQMITLAKYGQIDEQYLYNEDSQKILFFMMLSLCCHIGGEEEYTQNPFLFPYSYWRFLGNGAMDELLDYYKLEVLKGQAEPWNIVM